MLIFCDVIAYDIAKLLYHLEFVSIQMKKFPETCNSWSLKLTQRQKLSVFWPRGRGLVSIMNLGEQNFFLPNKGQLIGNFFEILLSKSQKLGGAMAPLAPPLTRALAPGNIPLNYFKICYIFQIRKPG